MIDKRLMYAQGQRVGGIRGNNAGSMLVTPTRDGSRPGYYGPDAGHENDPGHGSNAPGGGDGDSGNTNREKGIMSQYTGPKGTTGNINDFTGDKDGVDRSAVGPGSKYASNKFREGMLKSIKEIQTNPKYGGGGFFDTGLGKFVKGIGMFYAPQIFGPKFATGVKAYKTAKVAKDFLDQTDILSTFDVKNSIADMFSGNKTSTSKSKSTSKNNTTTNNGGKGDGEGLASLENQAGNYDEYILLLQKLQSGNISESERNRYNVLKNMLGI